MGLNTLISTFKPVNEFFTKIGFTDVILKP